jgi:hypothetical protein
VPRPGGSLTRRPRSRHLRSHLTIEGIRAELPKSEKSKQAGQQIEEAEKALQLSEAELAKVLGYRLCSCTFPPEIMLWKEKEKARICAACGHRYPPKVEVGKLTTPGPWRSR